MKSVLCIVHMSFFPTRTKELEIEVCKLKCEVISLIQGSIKIPLKGKCKLKIQRQLLGNENKVHRKCAPDWLKLGLFPD